MSKVLLKKSGHIALLTLNRPEVRNAIDPETLCRMADAFAELAADDGVRVVVVTGAGRQAFCAGGDLGRLIPLLSGERAPEDDWDRRFPGRVETMFRALQNVVPSHLVDTALYPVTGLKVGDVLPSEGGDTAFDKEEFRDPVPADEDGQPRRTFSILDSRPKAGGCGE